MVAEAAGRRIYICGGVGGRARALASSATPAKPLWRCMRLIYYFVYFSFYRKVGFSHARAPRAFL